MLICYLDESGNTGRRLDDPDQPIHILAAVIVREDRIRDMEDQLQALAEAAPTEHPLIEYHGDQLFHGSGPWQGVIPSRRVEEYAKALAVMGEVDAGVAHASINKPLLSKNQNPHLLALQYLTEKIERWLRGQRDELSKHALLVADHNHEHDAYSFDLIKEMQTGGGPIGDHLGLNVSLDHIVDGVYFAHSERSRGIQLADLVAFVLNRSERIERSPGARRSDEAIEMLRREYILPQRRTWRELWPRHGERQPGPAGAGPGAGWTDEPR